MQDLPQGTVTFLFTDIESSTRLWQEHAEAMSSAYARHDAILRAAVESERGVIFKTVGDAFQVAFPTAIGGVIAALRAQQALVHEVWGIPEPLMVRMALHTGAVDPDPEGDYRSPILNRLGRLLSAGYGGQVLVSQATMELARDALPSGASFLDLGDQRLKDLSRSERVYQLKGAGLPESFPPLQTLDTRPNNLPTQLTQFIGRQGDVRSLVDLLSRADVRLLTLTGPGGIGKTRLSLQVAADALEMFVDGVVFVRLDSITDHSLVLTAVAQEFGLREDSDVPILTTLTTYLRDKCVLLILDNFEQVVEAATLIGDLLVACPGLKVLVTSRVRLQIRGEQEYAVLPLQLSRRDSHEDIATISRYESVRLFADRARLVKPAFSVTEENASTIAEICARLDGLPLAIELTAARIRMLPPESMLRRLGVRLSLLTGGARDLPARQQTLRGAIEWSYDLLIPGDQALFRRLSVFAGGASFEAIESVAIDEGQEWSAFDSLERLVDQSLVRQLDVNGESRFAMYETIREYASVELEAQGEANEAHRRHADYLVSMADQFDMNFSQDAMASWLDSMDDEQENLRSVMTWLIANDPPGAYHLLVHAARYWQWRGHHREGKSWLERVLELPRGGARDLDVANALRTAGIFVNHPVDTSRYLAWLEESVVICRSIGDPYWLAHALSGNAVLADWNGNRERAIEMGAKALELARETGDSHLLVWMLNNQGNYFGYSGQFLEAGTCFDEMQDLLKQIPDSSNAPLYLSSLGDYCRFIKDFDRAEQYYLMGLPGAVKCRLWSVLSSNLMGLAITASDNGRYERAARIGGAEAAVRQVGDLGMEHDPDMVNVNDVLKRALATAAEKIGPEVFREAWHQGAALPLKDLLDEVLSPRAEVRS